MRQEPGVYLRDFPNERVALLEEGWGRCAAGGGGLEGGPRRWCVGGRHGETEGFKYLEGKIPHRWCRAQSMTGI